MKVRPDMRTIFTSGYVSDILRKQGILEKDLNFIPNPISPPDFLTKIYQTLHNKSM